MRAIPKKHNKVKTTDSFTSITISMLRPLYTFLLLTMLSLQLMSNLIFGPNSNLLMVNSNSIFVLFTKHRFFSSLFFKIFTKVIIDFACEYAHLTDYLNNSSKGTSKKLAILIILFIDIFIFSFSTLPI
jgi:hypothetical protein